MGARCRARRNRDRLPQARCAKSGPTPTTLSGWQRQAVVSRAYGRRSWAGMAGATIVAARASRSSSSAPGASCHLLAPGDLVDLWPHHQGHLRGLALPAGGLRPCRGWQVSGGSRGQLARGSGFSQLGVAVGLDARVHSRSGLDRRLGSGVKPSRGSSADAGRVLRLTVMIGSLVATSMLVAFTWVWLGGWSGPPTGVDTAAEWWLNFALPRAMRSFVVGAPLGCVVGALIARCAVPARVDRR